MKISTVNYGSLLSYTPRGKTQKEIDSKIFRHNLKAGRYVRNDTVSMPDWIADLMKRNMEKLPFADFFQSNTVLVPVPKSAPMKDKANTLWVPKDVAYALVAQGLGKEVISCLVRTKPVKTAHLGMMGAERPKAIDHYNSVTVQGTLSKTESIVLIDDFVTRGATFLGCANRLIEVFPKCKINAFAVMRTISYSPDFKNVYSPCIGTVNLCGEETFRRP
ncbi:MAG: phosphoribosyltransferase [Candidatus Bathyarchaeota archaeon]|nr:phosphoribosyltransferase [Candidatus Termiticorpusculum sp.]